MPTQPSFRRLWCVNCQEWELFDKDFSFNDLLTPLFCAKCKTQIDENVTLGDIPKEKILEQRQRYKENRKNSNRMALGLLMSLGMNSVSGLSERRIVEHDAGLLEIEKERSRIEQEKRQELYAERAKYVKVQRNQICPCGSGKKFKHCHISIM